MNEWQKGVAFRSPITGNVMMWGAWPTTIDIDGFEIEEMFEGWSDGVEVILHKDSLAAIDDIIDTVRSWS